MSKPHFKKGKKETGLAAIVNPYPDTYISLKRGGDKVGRIFWVRDTGKWKIGVTVKSDDSSCGWVWTFFKYKPDTETEAREFVIKHWDTIVALGLHEIDYGD